MASNHALKKAVGRHDQQWNGKKGNGPQKAGADKAPAFDVSVFQHYNVTSIHFDNQDSDLP